MKPSIVLFRKDLSTEEEFEAARSYIMTCETRSEVPENFCVVGRYSVLPFYGELVKDLASKGSFLINTKEMHDWIANFWWYEKLKDFTPKTWKEHEFAQCDHPGPFVVKGATNSRKFEWNRLMFAKDKPTASSIACELSIDGLISSQEIIFREHVPLKVVETGLNGLPFAVEYRFFFLKDKLIDCGYYWSIAEKAEELKEAPKEAIEKATEIAKIVSKHTNFFVLDLALTEDNKWILVELNDAQMSGLSTIEPRCFYNRLSKQLYPWTT